MFSGFDQTLWLWIGIGLLVVLAGVWLAISMSSSRETLKGGTLLLDRTAEEIAAEQIAPEEIAPEEIVAEEDDGEGESRAG